MSDLPSDTLPRAMPLAISIKTTELNEINQPKLGKILMDQSVTMLLLIALAVPMLIVAALIKIDSSGPVFFRQPRVGHRNQIFLIWKFRTMRHDAADFDGTRLTERNDPRLTRIGAWLRKHSIDEAPQLFNVLVGEMSLVGPRPHPINARAGDRLYRDIVPDYSRRHVVRPGITGWAQVNGWRGETVTADQIKHRVAHDMEYIVRQSLLLDMWIIVLTVLLEIRSKAAF